MADPCLMTSKCLDLERKRDMRCKSLAVSTSKAKDNPLWRAVALVQNDSSKSGSLSIPTSKIHGLLRWALNMPLFNIFVLYMSRLWQMFGGACKYRAKGSQAQHFLLWKCCCCTTRGKFLRSKNARKNTVLWVFFQEELVASRQIAVGSWEHKQWVCQTSLIDFAVQMQIKPMEFESPMWLASNPTQICWQNV